MIRSINFEGGDDRGVQVINKLVMGMNREGLHWFNVYLDEELIARLPIRVVYQRISGPQLGPILPTQ